MRATGEEPRNFELRGSDEDDTPSKLWVFSGTRTQTHETSAMLNVPLPSCLRFMRSSMLQQQKEKNDDVEQLNPVTVRAERIGDDSLC
ncbi:hypothetical protein TNCV_816051 [Trichonephila clavipes]|nr:hypothetical protein TNCV_816051 [Trichonephila clavipes]